MEKLQNFMIELMEGGAFGRYVLWAVLFVLGSLLLGSIGKAVFGKRSMLGTAVSMKNLTVKSAKTSENSDALTLYCEVDGKEVQLHMPAIYDAYNQPITAQYFDGKTFDVKGIVDVFYETYQIEFYSIDDITFH